MQTIGSSQSNYSVADFCDYNPLFFPTDCKDTVSLLFSSSLCLEQENKLFAGLFEPLSSSTSPAVPH